MVTSRLWPDSTRPGAEDPPARASSPLDAVAVAGTDKTARIEQDQLFSEPGEPTLSVTELTAHVRSSLARAFPAEVWVRGEVQKLSHPPSGHVYFTLAEARGGQTAAAIAVTLLAREKRQIDAQLAGIPVELANGAEVRIRAKVTVYVPRGQLQLEMTGLDPYFTMGKIAAQRARVLATLRADQLLERNRQRSMPDLPLRVALVTSRDSAAYHDFVHELEVSGFGFSVAVCDARVQGQGAPRSLAAGLRAAVAQRPDVVVVVRGGGAQHDLAAFDHEAVARLIARAPVPVVVGVGHQVDRSVADEVAHTSCKTPTACAQVLVNAVRDASHAVEAHAAALVVAARQLIDAQTRYVGAVRERLEPRTRQHLVAASHRLDRIADGLRRRSDAVLDAQAHQLERRRARAAQRSTVQLERERLTVDHRTARLGRAALAPLESAHAHVDAVDERVRALDPARVLARGYSITRRANGRAARSVADLVVGDELHTRLAVGVVVSRVEATEEP